MKCLYAACLSLVSLALVGCDQDSAGPRAVVSGTVTLDGKPLETALLRFRSKDQGADVVAIVEDGSFHLDQADGPTIGAHDVVVVPHSPELAQAIEAMQSGDRDPLKSRTVPVKYQTPGALPAAIITDSDNHLQFELTSH